MTQDGVRTIDAGAPPARFARGWHCLGLAAPLPRRRTRTRSRRSARSSWCSRPTTASSTCSTDTAGTWAATSPRARSRATTIACPFHDWRWGGNGKCVEIPYAKRVPLRARTRSWITLEENKQLFVWNDPQGNPPPENITIPRIDAAFSSEWSNWTWDSVRDRERELP